MRQSRRAKRMERHYKRAKRGPGFNIISLMDIFTILVFFLLVNASEIEILPTTSEVELPESVAEQKPRESVIVVVTEKDILLQGAAIVSASALVDDSEADFERLKAALKREGDAAAAKYRRDDETEREITIMGDKTIPFRLLRKVMLTCTQAGFNKISLSVVQKVSQKG